MNKLSVDSITKRIEELQYTKRLEENLREHGTKQIGWQTLMLEAADALKDAMERESRVRELHESYESANGSEWCDACNCPWPCSTIAILDGGEG